MYVVWIAESEDSNNNKNIVISLKKINFFNSFYYGFVQI